MAQPRTRLQIADRLGFATSMLCAIHCAALPVLMALLPTLGLGSQGWVDIDQGIVVFATLLAITTLSIGWRRHRTYHALGLLLPALLLLWFGAFGPFHAHGDEQQYAWLHLGPMVLGGVLLALAHLTNMRLSHRAAVLAVAENRG